MENWQEIAARISQGDQKALARAITMVENDLPGSKELLKSFKTSGGPAIIGFTGPPGAGKSTLINAVIRILSGQGKKIAVLAVDPTSPFNFGSLLGDRIRMAEHFNDPNVFIRSLASRGSLGGLSEKTIEVLDVLRNADFDLILLETVGVGQSEVEIAGLADTTVVILVPESGDEIQTLKSGIMEIADIFVVNKADRSGADAFLLNLQKLVHDSRPGPWIVPVIKTVADKNEGVSELINAFLNHRADESHREKQAYLQTEKAYRLIQLKRMKGVKKSELMTAIKEAMGKANFNLYQFADQYNS